MEAILHFDGGIRKGTMAYGWILLNPNDETEVIASGNKTCGTHSSTSNIAEYRALIAGINGCLKNKVNIVHIYGDSLLIINQVIGVFKTNKHELKKHRDYVLKLLEKFENYTIKWVPRRENKRADALVNAVFQNKCPKKQRKSQRR